MVIICFFTNVGSPALGLTPTIDIWESDGMQVVTAASMAEIDGGFYKYDFTTYDEEKDYCFRADGGAGLKADDRYKFATNGIDLSVKVDELHKLQGLDAANPMTVTPTSRTAGTISQTISGDGTTTTTVTRNP